MHMKLFCGFILLIQIPKSLKLNSEVSEYEGAHNTQRHQSNSKGHLTCVQPGTHNFSEVP